MNTKHRRFLLDLLIVCAASLLFPAVAGVLYAGVQTPELRVALQRLEPEEEIRVIVKFSQRADIESLKVLPRPLRRSLMLRDMMAAAERGQREVNELIKQRGVKGARNLWAINGLALKARPALIQELSERPDVQSVQLDRTIHKSDVLLQSFASPEFNLTQINAPGLWQSPPGGYFGQGAVVGLMDTGADVHHPDLAGRWRGGTNSWFDPYEASSFPFDDDGHGTSVLGIMVGGDASGRTIGAAPAAKWIAVRMFDDSGTTFLSVIHLLFQWFLDPDGNPATDDAPDVVNGSWGFESLPGVCDNEFQADIDALNAAGIAVVFAGGNGGPNPSTSISPANNLGAMAVGFVDAGSIIYSLSS
ncbi:MAG: S8 family serine peptidase, partial [Desulfobacterales bacterium]|nr:S8 family serine peptidase [Desulfobacterales bacterium]